MSWEREGPERPGAGAAQALRSVEARLNLLSARAGLSYTLTTHSHERAVRVTASHGVTLVAQRPLPDPCAPALPNPCGRGATRRNIFRLHSIPL